MTLPRFGLLSLVLPLAATPSMLADEPGPETSVVWKASEDGVAVYTIPGVLVTSSGVVIAYAEARDRRGDGGPVDMVIKRSLDGGRSWTKSNFIERGQGADNFVLSTLVQDRVSGRVFFFTALRDGGLSDRTTTNHYRYSDDNGTTWSAPHDITGALYAADERIQRDLRAGRAPSQFEGDDPELFGRQLIFFGPGRPIQLSAQHPRHPNRLVVPLFYIKDRVLTPRSKRGYGNAVLVSDDGGRSWFVPGTVPQGDYGSSEISIVELDDGSILMNARGAPPTSSGMTTAGRTVSYSHDGGATWTRPAPDTSGIPEYIETSSGMLRLSHPQTDPDGKSRILFSFPHSLPPEGARPGVSFRANGTILLSYDEGRSWPVRKLLVPGSFGYSNMDVLPDGTILVVYENATGTSVSATRFTLEWLTGGADSPAVPSALPLGSSSLEGDVLRIDERRISALLEGDVTALRTIFHPDCVYTHGSGLVESGTDYLGRLERGDLMYLKMQYDGPPTLHMRGRTAVVSGRILLTGQGRTGPANDRVMIATGVYVQDGPSWRLVSFQNTPAPAVR